MKDSWNGFWGTVIAAWRHLPERKPKMRRAVARVASPALLSIESLEDRLYLSAFYKYDIIAQTGGELTSIQPAASINDSGQVAFVASTSVGQSIYVADSDSGPRIISFASPTSSRTYGQELQINNAGAVGAVDRVNGATVSSLARIWDANNPGDNLNIIARGISPTPTQPGFEDYFDIISSFTTLSNAGQQAFAGLNDTFTEIHLSDTLVARGDLSSEVTDFQTGNFFRFMAADGDELVVGSRNTASGLKQIKLYDTTGADSVTTIASTTGGQWSDLGVRPGISDDGRIVTFYGSEASDVDGDGIVGPGVFASVERAIGRSLVRIASLADGLSAFAVDQRISVSNMNEEQHASAIVFQATDDDGKVGLFTSQLKFELDPVANSIILGFTASTPSSIILQGETIDGLGTVTNVAIHDSVNNSGTVTFWADTSGGQAIVCTKLPAQRVVLAWGYDVPIQILKINGTFRTDYRINPMGGTMPAFAAAPNQVAAFEAYKAAAPARVQQQFVASGIEDIEVVNGEPERGATVVYFTDPLGSLLGMAYTGIDRYNRRSSDEVVVMVNYFNPSLDPDRDIETITHEVGHSLGLRHINPIGALEVMDYDASPGDLEVFSDTPYFITEPPETLGHITLIDHNPVYHLKRYVEGIPASDLEELGLQSGAWDRPGIIYTERDEIYTFRLLDNSSPANTTLYNVYVAASKGSPDAVRTLEYYESITLAELSQHPFSLGEDEAIGLIAASTPGGEHDVVLASGDPFVETNLDIFPEQGGNYFLQVSDSSPSGYSTLAAVTATIGSQGTNQPPVATGDSGQTQSGNPVQIAVLANDTDADGSLDLTTVTVVQSPTNGSVSVNAVTGAITYSPNTNFTGTDTFTYKVKDNQGAESNVATVTLTVQAAPPHVNSVTRIDNGTGKVQIAIEFSDALQTATATDSDNFAIVDNNGQTYRIASAAYSLVGGRGRVVLTTMLNADEFPTDNYTVRIDGTQVLSSTGIPLTTARENLLSHQVWEKYETVTIGANGSGSAVLLSGPELTGLTPPKFIVQNDFNADGIQDYVATGDLTGELVFHFGRAEGGYATSRYPLPGPTEDLQSSPQSLMVTDWNLDGHPDLIVTDRVSDYFQGVFNRLFILINDGSGHFANAADSPIPIESDAVGTVLGVGDFTGDGQMDIAVAGRLKNVNSPHAPTEAFIAIYGKDPFLGYSKIDEIAVDHPNEIPVSGVTADLDGDGRLDLIMETDYFPIIFLNSSTGLHLGDDVDYYGEPGQMAVADFTGDGKLDIAIVNDNYSNGAGIHEGGVISLLVGQGLGRFIAQPNIILNRRSVTFAAVGDINQDGKADLVLRADPFEQFGFDTTTQISIWTLLGDGFGTFDLSSPLMPLAPTQDVVPGNFLLKDLTGDGFPELSFGNQATGRIGVFVNDGVGRLLASTAGPLTSTITGARSQYEQESLIVIADFNRDGYPDQARAVSDVGVFQSQAIDIFWGTESGQFEIASSVNVPSYERSIHDQYIGDIGFLRVGDLNHDGWLDLIVGADNGNGGPLMVLKGVDGRNFEYAPSLFVDAGDAKGVVTGNPADVNGDGNLDFVAVVNASGSGITGFGIFFGNGTGLLTYNPNAFQTVPGMQTQIPIVADFNRDGKVDVALGTQTYNGTDQVNSILIYQGLGNGKFNLGQTITRSSADIEPHLFLADINGDGRPDLLSPNEGGRTLDFYLATNTGQFVAAPDLTIPAPYSAAQLVVGDFTGDGLVDIAISQDTTTISQLVSTVPIFHGDGTGHFSEPQLIETGALWPFNLSVVPVGGAVNAGTFTIIRPILTVPAGVLNISTTTKFERPVAINPRPLLVNYSDDPLSLAVSVAPAHGTVILQNQGTLGDPSDDTFSYSPAPGFSGRDQFTYVVTDGRGGTATGVVVINVGPANQNPVITLTPGALNYFNLYESRTIDPGATVTDADATDFLGAKLKIEITSGFNADFDYLELDTAGDGPGELSWDFDGTLSYSGMVIGKVSGGYHEPMVISFTTPAVTSAIIQDVLRHVQYSSSDSDRTLSSQRTVTFLVTDGKGGAGTATKTILLPAEGSNLLPVVTTSTSGQFYTVGSPAIVIDNGATVTDADTPILDGGSLTVDCANFTIFDDRLAIRTEGIGTGQINLNGTSVRYGSIPFGTYSGGFVDSSPLVITFNSNATPAIVQALVRQITFSNVDAFDPYMEPRNIRFVVNDGAGGVSAPALRTITFIVGNAAPEITLSSGTTSFTAGQSPVTIDAAIFVDDSDSDDFGGGTLTVDFQSGQSAADRLSIRNVGTGLGQINLVGNTVNFGSIPLGTYSGGFTSNSPLVISFNTNASPARVELLMRQLTFQVDGVAPTTSDRVIRFVISDGDGGVSVPVTRTVLVGSAGGSQAPGVQLPSTSPTYSKLGPAVAIDSLAVVQAPSTGTGTVGGGILTISINDVNTGKKKLDVFNLSALNVVGTSRGTQLINGRLVTVYDLDENVSASVVQNALRGVKFQTSKKGLKYTTRTIQIQLADSEGDTSAVVTKTINVSKKKIKAT